MSDRAKELINDLEETGTLAILITFVPSNLDGTLVAGDGLRIQSSDSLDDDATVRKLLAIAFDLGKSRGLIGDDFKWG